MAIWDHKLHCEYLLVHCECLLNQKSDFKNICAVDVYLFWVSTTDVVADFIKNFKSILDFNINI